MGYNVNKKPPASPESWMFVAALVIPFIVLGWIINHV